MDNSDMAKLFYPGVRKAVFVQGISLLETTEGEKRIRLEMSMEDDGRLIGMPFYFADPYEHIAKADSVEKFSKLELDFEAMSLYLYTTEDHDKSAQVLFNVKMGSFMMVRGIGNKDEAADVSIKFVAKVPSNPKLWSWLYAYHRATVFIRFEPTQADISDAQAKAQPDKQMKLDDKED